MSQVIEAVVQHGIDTEAALQIIGELQDLVILQVIDDDETKQVFFWLDHPPNRRDYLYELRSTDLFSRVDYIDDPRADEGCNCSG